MAGLDPAEEVAEGSPKILDGLLRGRLGHFQHPGERVCLDGVELAAQGGFVRLLARLVLALPLVQRPVPGEARHAAGAGEEGALLNSTLSDYPLACMTP